MVWNDLGTCDEAELMARIWAGSSRAIRSFVNTQRAVRVTFQCFQNCNDQVYPRDDQEDEGKGGDFSVLATTMPT